MTKLEAEFLLAHGFTPVIKGGEADEEYYENKTTGWGYSDFAMQFKSPDGRLVNFEDEQNI